MKPSERFENGLLNWMVENSGLDLHRSYIGLSKAWECPRVIYDQFFQPSPPPGPEKFILTFYSYQLEGLIIQWLGQRFGSRIKPGPEVSLHDGLIQGHGDALWDDDLVEIKTVQQVNHFPRDGRVPQRVYHQVQAYLHFFCLQWCQVIYFARDTGQLMVIPVPYNQGKGAQIEAKFNRLVWQVKNKERPECLCESCEK